MKPKFKTAKFHNPTLGASLVTAIVVCFGASTSFAADWTGTTSSDWNTGSNWSTGFVPSGENAVVGTGIAVISEDISATPQDIIVLGGGQIDHTAGVASTGAGNWMTVGQDTAGGIYNLADTGLSDGGISGYAEGSGSLNANALLIVGGFGGDRNGILNVNTSGTLSVAGEFFIGDGTGSSGTLNLQSGTVAASNNTFVGKSGSAGELNISGGSFSLAAGNLNIGTDGGTGNLTQSGGTLTSAGELKLGNGTIDLSGSGSIVSNSWSAIGGGGATADFNMSGGTFAKNGGGNFIIGDDAASTGTMTQTGGASTVTGDMWIGNGSGVGTYNLSAGSMTVSGVVSVAFGAGSTGTANLDGGTLTARQIIGNAGLAEVNFNGTQIIATGDEPAFVSNLDTATIGSGGLRVDSAGFSVVIPQILSGTGSITKTGLGTLSLTGAQLYTSATTVNAGKLVTSTEAADGGSYSVADGATLGVITAFDDANQLEAVNVTLATTAAGTALDFDLGGFAGNPSVASLKSTGNLVVNGNITINVADSLPTVGTVDLFEYVAGNRSGSGVFVLGTLPLGVTATLSDVAGVVSLEVTDVAPLPRWEGDVSGVWDTVTANWVNLVSGGSTVYTNGNSTLFDDNAAGLTSIVLNTTVAPGMVTFSNSVLSYTLSGTGKITGTTDLNKTGSGSLDLGTANNDYTGVTRLQGGTTSVAVLSNGGAASGIGAAPAAASNLLVGSATLSYTGPSTTIDRGFTINGTDAGISTNNDLTLGGLVGTAGGSNGSLVKAGAGKLILSNPGALTIGSAGQSNKVALGTLSLDGSGTQTVALAGSLQVGTAAGTSRIEVLNSTVITGATQIAQAENSTSTALVSGSGSLSTGTLIVGNAAGAVGTLTVETGGTLSALGDLILGDAGTSSGNLNLAGGTINTTGNVSVGDDGTGIVTQSAGMLTAGNELWIGNNGGGNGTVNLSGSGAIVSNSWTAVGRGGGTGAFNMSGGSFTKNGGGNFIIGDTGPGVMTQTGGVATVNGEIWIGNGAAVTDATYTLSAGSMAGSGSIIVGFGDSTGTLNLDGGTLTISEIVGGSGTGTVNFNGTQIIATEDREFEPFISGLDTANIEAGGLNVDSAGFNLDLFQDLGGVGGVNKKGGGFLYLSGANTYTGNTLVEDGVLSIQSPSNFADSSTLTIGTVALSPAVLDLPNPGTDTVASLVIDGGAPVAEGVWGRVGSIASLGADFETDAITGSGLIEVAGLTPYASWIAGPSGFFPGETNPAIIGVSVDPDNDGQSNGLEFALGGAPNSGSNNAKIYTLKGDGSVDPDSTEELLMTIAVLSGTPAFAGSPSPKATRDGATYTIEGSLNLTTFLNSVTPVAPVTIGLPAVPAGYEYRTFSLDGSNAFPGKGFLRVNVEN